MRFLSLTLLLGFALLGAARGAEKAPPMEITTKVSERRSCFGSLILMARKALTGNGLAGVGLGMDELFPALEKAKFSTTGTNAVHAALHTVIQQATPGTALVDVLGTILPADAGTHEGETLAICVGGEDCAFKSDPQMLFTNSMHGMVKENFDIVPVAHDRNVQMDGPPRQANPTGLLRAETIVLNNFDAGKRDLNHPERMVAVQNRMEFVSWNAQLLRDATKFATNQLISNWVKANLRRQPKDRDTIFKTYVRVEGGRYRVDDKFYYTLVYGRSGKVWTDAEAILLKRYLGADEATIRSTVADQDSSHRSGTLKDIEHDAPGSTSWFRLEPKSVFEKADQMATFMQNTISTTP